ATSSTRSCRTATGSVRTCCTARGARRGTRRRALDDGPARRRASALAARRAARGADAGRAVRRRRARAAHDVRTGPRRRAARGVRAGTVVSWQLPTRIDALVLVAALARLGAVQNPILPFLREREVGFIVRQCRARLLIVPGVFRGFDHDAMARALAAGGWEL